MEKINTIGKTITGLSNKEYNMIIRALKARAIRFQEKACEAKDNIEWHNERDVSRAYSDLAKFIEKQNQ